MKTSTKLIGVAVAAEMLLVGTGLSLAIAQGLSAYGQHGQLSLAASAAAFPLILATLEFFKIPAGWSLCRARWAMKPFAGLLLAGGMVATFETVTMAGSTWFRSIQFEVTAAQAELSAMSERHGGAGGETTRSAQVAEALDGLDRQIAGVSTPPEAAAAQARFDALSAEIDTLLRRRAEARAAFAADWDTQTANNTARINSGNPAVAEQGLASQRSRPTRQAYVDARLADWDANEGQSLQRRIEALEGDREAARRELDEARTSAAGRVDEALRGLRAERSAMQGELAAALEEERRRQADRTELGLAIERQRLLVAELAGESVIYDIAAKAYAIPAHAVSEEQANIVTYWVVLGVGLAAAVSTGLAAFLAAHLDGATRSAGHLRALRAVRRGAAAVAQRDRLIAELRGKLAEAPPVQYRERVVYRYLPIDRELAAEPHLAATIRLDEERARAA